MSQTVTVEEFSSIELKAGAHARREDGMCIMEAAAWFAGKVHTDDPPCVARPLRAVFMRANDLMSDADRQSLKRYIPFIVGTAGNADADQRAGLMAVDWLVRDFAPSWMDLVPSLADTAAKLRGLGPIDSWAKARDARPLMEEARTKAYAAAAYYAAYAAYAAKRKALADQAARSRESFMALLDRMVACYAKAA